MLIGHGGQGRQVEVPAVRRTYTDGLNGETVWTYHARLAWLEPGNTYNYTVTAANSSRAAKPFAANFTTAPEGRQAFRFTSFGDLATPNTEWVLSYGQSTYAVDQVEAQRPLFHLLNGDLCYANLNPTPNPRSGETSETTTSGRRPSARGCPARETTNSSSTMVRRA